MSEDFPTVEQLMSPKKCSFELQGAVTVANSVPAVPWLVPSQRQSDRLMLCSEIIQSLLLSRYLLRCFAVLLLVLAAIPNAALVGLHLQLRWSLSSGSYNSSCHGLTQSQFCGKELPCHDKVVSTHHLAVISVL